MAAILIYRSHTLTYLVFKIKTIHIKSGYIENLDYPLQILILAPDRFAVILKQKIEAA